MSARSQLEIECQKGVHNRLNVTKAFIIDLGWG